jgi:hypothetical protein
MPFTLPPDYTIKLHSDQGGQCAVTGVKFSLERFADALVKHPFAPSVDRRLSSGSYTEDNVRLVCVAVNFGMGQWGEEVFLTLARAAVDREARAASDPGPDNGLACPSARAYRRCRNVTRQATQRGTSGTAATYRQS